MTPTPEALAKEITRQVFVEGCSLGHANQILVEALEAARRDVEDVLAHALLRWSLRDWEGADVFAGDHVPFWTTWEQIRARAKEVGG